MVTYFQNYCNNIDRDIALPKLQGGENPSEWIVDITTEVGAGMTARPRTRALAPNPTHPHQQA